MTSSPNVYGAIGVNKSRVIKWQDATAFDSAGVDQTGALLAPGYPIFSRLAWAVMEPVDLEGRELRELLDEIKKAAAGSDNLAIQLTLRKLSTLAEKAFTYPNPFCCRFFLRGEEASNVEG